MAGGNNGATLREVHRLWDEGTVSGLSETQLLERFLTRRDEVAFEALVSRHGPMVLGVCRRLLRDPHAIDDAFQATFLILVRKARALRAPQLLGPWLYGVAYRVALRSRTVAARRSSRETPYTESAAVPDDDPGNEIRPVIDEELGRLPERYRAALVLCYLEGHTHHEAAERLRCPVGTVRSRLARGRERLRHRLIRRGLAPAGLVAADVLVPRASAAVPPVLLHATVAAATRYAAGKLIAAGVVSVSAAALTQGVLTTMFVSKLKIVAVALLALGLSGGGAHFLTKHGALAAQAPDGPGAAEAPKEQPAPQDDLALLQGVWEITERSPKNPPGKEFVGETWKIQGANLTFGRKHFVYLNDDGDRLEGGPLEVVETIQLDQQATPKRITISAPRPGNPRLLNLQGIYQLKGDHLRVRLAPRGAPFPADFSSEIRGLTIVLKRQSLRKEDANQPPAQTVKEEGAQPSKPPKAPSAPQDDLALLQGVWQVTEVVPKQLSRRLTVGKTWKIQGSKLTIREEDFVREDGGRNRLEAAALEVFEEIQLDQQLTPKQITISPPGLGLLGLQDSRALNASHVLDSTGIYQLEGDHLRIRFGPGTAPLLTDFSTKSPGFSLVLKRQPPLKGEMIQPPAQTVKGEGALAQSPDRPGVADQPKEQAASDDDLERLQGIWRVMEVEPKWYISDHEDNWSFQGTNLITSRLRPNPAILRDTQPPWGPFGYGIELDSRATPKRITLSPPIDPLPGTIVPPGPFGTHGIYQLQGDDLQVLFSPGERPAPSDFKMKAGNLYLVFKRQVTGGGAQARAFLKNAEERLEWSRRMLAKGYVSREQVLADEATLQRAMFALNTPGADVPAVPGASANALPPSQPQEEPKTASIRELELRLKLARMELERSEELYKRQVVALSSVQEQRIKVAIVEAQLDAAKERLVAAKPASDNPQTSSAPSPDRPAFQGLENRLKRAQRVLAIMKQLNSNASVPATEVEKAGASLDAVVEEIETQNESLSDDLELLEAQKLRKEAELRVAEAPYRPGSSLMKMTIEEGKAQIDVKKAELLEVEVRIKQCKRKRDQIERLKKEVEPPK